MGADAPKAHGSSAFSLPAPENLQKEKNAGPPKNTAAQLS
jgi:hypothetical protein